MNRSRLILRWGEKPVEELYMRNNEHLSELAKWYTRVGHSERFIEAFANIYKNFALTAMFKKMRKNQIVKCLILQAYTRVLEVCDLLKH